MSFRLEYNPILNFGDDKKSLKIPTG